MSSSKKKKTGVTSAIASVDEAPPTAVVVKGVIEELPISPTRKKKPALAAAKSDTANSKSSTLKPPNERKAKEFLTKHQWPSGLQDALVKSCKKIAVRYIITDDSGSMMTNDGHRMVGMGTKNVKMIQCTRWSELTASLKFHAELAQAAQAPTEFRLLNNCEPIMVGLADDKDGAALQAALTIFEEESPAGQTPLCYHIGEVIECIKAQEDELRSSGRRACVVIATDGESTDGDLANAMRPLQHLPVWVVVRLCTDEESTVQYWNSIDEQLELEMDVLDDLSGEAGEVTAANPWLVYGDPLHKLREFGASIKEMDLLDESALSSEQMRVMCAILVSGGDTKSLPHPDEDWAEFFGTLKARCQAEGPVWDPLTKTMREWVDLKKLQAMYGGGAAGAGSGACALS